MSSRQQTFFFHESTSCAQESPASPSAKPASVPGSPTSDGSGPTSNASSPRRGRASSSSRTSLDSFGGAWTPLSPGSPHKVSPWKPRCLEPITSAHLIDATGSSWWPTATAADGRASGGRPVNALDAQSRNKRTHPGTSLTDAVVRRPRWFPTVTAASYGTTNNGSPLDGREAYATKGTPSLTTAACRQGGSLNPQWVEALMGFPVDWTLRPEGERKRPGRPRRGTPGTTGNQRP